jgi:hypothetical protein
MPADTLPERPRTAAHVVSALGDWGVNSGCGGGVVELATPAINGRGRVQVHIRLISVFDLFFDTLHKRDLMRYVSDVSGYKVGLRHHASTGMGVRRHHLSSWGAAVVLNRAKNKEGQRQTSKNEDDFVFYPEHPVVMAAEECGLVWGGRATWPSGKKNRYPDPATFQYSTEW